MACKILTSSSSTCRICLESSFIMLDVFDEVSDFNMKISEMIEMCGDLKIEESDDHSKLICEQCTQELFISIKFKEKCRKSAEILSSLIENFSSFTADSNDATSKINAHLKDFTDKPPEKLINDVSVKLKLREKNPKSCNYNFNEKVEPVDPLSENEELCASEHEIYDSDGSANSTMEYDKRVECSTKSGKNFNKIDTAGALDSEIKTENTSFFDEDTNTNDADSYECVEYLENDKDVTYITILKNDDDFEDNDSSNQIDRLDIVGDDALIVAEEILESAATEDDNLTNEQAIFEPPKKKLKHTSPITHISSVTQINFTCDVCGAGFMHSVNLKRHLTTVHQIDENNINTCSLCSLVFTTITDFEDHVKEHGLNVDEKQHNLEFLKDSSNIDDSRRSVQCSECNKKFVSKSALKSHLRIHTGEKPFKCTECPKSFATLGGLDLHQRRHSGLKPYKCVYCNRAFVESSNLKAHLRTHTGEKPHICTVCNKGFSRVFLLNIHQRTHTGEKPYQCKICSKSFAQQGDLSAHVRIHTGERPHQCNVCHKGFIKSSGLQSHLKRHAKIMGLKPSEDQEMALGSSSENDNQLSSKNVSEDTVDDAEEIDDIDESSSQTYIILEETRDT